MKQSIVFNFLLALTTILLVGCGSGNGPGDEGNGGVIATTPDQSCLYDNNCSYPAQLPAGWSGYPIGTNGYYIDHTNSYNNGFCGCPFGTQPVFNSQFGLACVSQGTIYSNTYSYGYWQWGSQGFHSFSTYAGLGYNAYRGNNCWQGALSACLTGSQCSSGTCQLVPGTQYGLCTQ